MFTLPYFQIYSCLFDMQLSPFIWCQRKNKPWKFHVIMTKTPWLFLVSFFLSISFSHSFVAQACASRVPIFIPAKQASLARRANFTSIWVYEWKRFSSLILNYWQPNSLCFFVSFAKLIKSVFKILFSPTKSFFCFHLGYLNLGESIKHN